MHESYDDYRDTEPGFLDGLLGVLLEADPSDILAICRGYCERQLKHCPRFVLSEDPGRKFPPEVFGLRFFPGGRVSMSFQGEDRLLPAKRS